MSHFFVEPLTRLRAIPIEENGEPLLDPITLSARIRFAARHPKFGNLPRTPAVRHRVAEMLAAAVERLPEGIDLQIIEGFRPLSQQRKMYQYLLAEFASEHPTWNKATLHRMTNRMCAPPDDSCPPPHTTGGAVDLCLIYADTGKPLDMTSPYGWDQNSAPTWVEGLSQQALKNRCLLINTLTTIGLTNYAGEWWHWSYGDSGWALRTQAPKAFYARLSESE